MGYAGWNYWDPKVTLTAVALLVLWISTARPRRATGVWLRRQGCPPLPWFLGADYSYHVGTIAAASVILFAGVLDSDPVALIGGAALAFVGVLAIRRKRRKNDDTA